MCNPKYALERSFVYFRWIQYSVHQIDAIFLLQRIQISNMIIHLVLIKSFHFFF